jgi:4-hydroxy-tetrahydrodipicolinate synthase
MKSFTASMTAIVTPFDGDRVDENALRNLVDWQIDEGISALVPCGTTGEAATLDAQERDRVVRIVIEQAAGRVPVIAGAGSNNTKQAIEFTRAARKAGADATLHVTPYYNKPMQEGLYQHFKAIAEADDLPVIPYNVPGRTAVNMMSETTLRLAEIANIVGIKEASGDLDQIRAIASGAPDGFAILSGEDAQNTAIYEAGGRGCISVTANIVPAQVARIWKQHESGDSETAARAQEELGPLNEAMFYETNPIPVKTALAMMGKVREEFRLPLTRMGEDNRARLADVLQRYGLSR